jgi:PAP2 superfamily
LASRRPCGTISAIPETLLPTRKLILLRAGLVAAGLAAWFATQALIGARHAATGTLPIDTDRILQLLTPMHDYLWTHVAARNALLIISSAGIDILALFMLARAIFGPTCRPFLGLLLLFGLRQIFQAICILPAPDQMIWGYPGFPSLLVTYGVSNDLFFSGHTALAVFGAVELARLHRRMIPLGVAIALFEIITVLSLRAHWTMDVYAGAVTALLVAFVVGKISAPVDRQLAKT